MVLARVVGAVELEVGAADRRSPEPGLVDSTSSQVGSLGHQQLESSGNQVGKCFMVGTGSGADVEVADHQARSFRWDDFCQLICQGPVRLASVQGDDCEIRGLQHADLQVGTGYCVRLDEPLILQVDCYSLAPADTVQVQLEVLHLEGLIAGVDVWIKPGLEQDDDVGA